MNTKKWTTPFAIVITGALCLTSVSATAGEKPVVEETASTAVADLIETDDLVQAVENYDSSDSALIDLVDVVTPESSVDLEDSDFVGLENDWLNAGFDEDSAVGMKLAGVESSEVVDGVVVSSNPDTGVEAVGRATEDGSQLVTVIDNEDAAQEVEYEINLPQGATLTPLVDGSISVSAPVEVEVSLPGEDARVEANIAEIVGVDATLDDLEELSDEQWEQIMEVPDAQTKTVVETQQIAVIETPWAVDAEGNALDTEYVVDGDTLVQKIHTDEGTVFPVIADPHWTWWVATSAACAVSIAAFAAPGVILLKGTKIAAKIISLAKKSTKITKAMKAIGGSKNAGVAVMKSALNDLKDMVIRIGKKTGGAAGKAFKTLGVKIPRPKMSTAQKTFMAAFGGFGVREVLDWAGVGSCGALVAEWSK